MFVPGSVQVFPVTVVLQLVKVMMSLLWICVETGYLELGSPAQLNRIRIQSFRGTEMGRALRLDSSEVSIWFNSKKESTSFNFLY